MLLSVLLFVLILLNFLTSPKLLWLKLLNPWKYYLSLFLAVKNPVKQTLPYYPVIYKIIIVYEHFNR